jgi:hypothetical protein
MPARRCRRAWALPAGGTYPSEGMSSQSRWLLGRCRDLRALSADVGRAADLIAPVFGLSKTGRRNRRSRLVAAGDGTALREWRISNAGLRHYLGTPLSPLGGPRRLPTARRP